MKTRAILTILILLSTLYGCNNGQQATRQAENLIQKDSSVRERNKSGEALTEKSKSRLDLYPAENKYFLSQNLKLEPIEKTEFNIQRSEAVNYLVYDTTSVRKNGLVLKLLCNSDTLKYVNNPGIPYDENLHEYKFVGEIPFLNVFVVNYTYYESLHGYIFIDKSTCKEVKVCDGYPHISVDKKHIINIDDDFDEGDDPSTYLNLYAIEGTKVKHLFGAVFKNWRPASEEMFWGKDGNFYLKAVRSPFPNGKITYLKVRLL